LNRVPRSRLGHDPRCGKRGKPLRDGTPVALDDSSFDSFVAKSELPGRGRLLRGLMRAVSRDGTQLRCRACRN
jgi:hypothetical protein